MAGRRMHPCGPFVLMGLLVAVSCGAPDTRVRDAASAEYRMRRDVLWSEIIQVVRERYPKMQIAVLDADRLVSQWEKTFWRVEGLVPSGGLHARVAQVPLYRRVIVAVTGMNPYRVAVDVEIATWERGPASSSVRATEASDQLMLEIHERLKAVEHAP